MIENVNRIGNFTSSEIYKLLSLNKKGDGFGAPALTYIKEKNLERRAGRSVETEVSTREMLWGKLLEKRVFDLLEFGYQLCSDHTDLHPTISFWAGSKDLIKPGVKIGDIKCYQPKNFMLFSDVLVQKNIELFKEEYPKEYWQLVSNAIINETPNAEAVAYMPYRSELSDIRDLADGYDDYDQYKYRFIVESEDAELAWLPDGGFYQNLVRFEFEVPQEDKDLLTEKVLKAGEMLVPRFVMAEFDVTLNAMIVSA